MNSFENFCSKCLHFDISIGVCNKIHENVRNYPNKFVKKCTGKFFKSDPNKIIEDDKETNNYSNEESENQVPTGFSVKFSSLPPLYQKILITILGLVVYRIGLYIPLPGVDITALWSYFFTYPNDYLINTFNFFSGGGLSKASIFALGIMPYTGSSALVLLMSGIIPNLRKLRDGSIEQTDLFNRLIYIVTALVAMAQSYGMALFLEFISSQFGGSIVPNSGWGFRLMVMLTLTAGSMVVVWIADLISKKGIANGVAFILLINFLSGVVPAILYELNQLISGNQLILNEIFTFIILIALTTISIKMLTAKRKLQLRYNKQNIQNEDDSNGAVTVPLRVNTVGAVPIYVAYYLMVPFVNLGHLQFDSMTILIIYFILIFILTFIWTAITFSAKDLINKIKQYGYSISGVNSGVDYVDYIDSIMVKLILPGAIFLGGIALVPFALTNWLGINFNLSFLYGGPLLIICAIVFDLIQKIRFEQERQKEIETAKDRETVELITIFTAETELEGEMVRGILYHEGINSMQVSNRVICASGTFAFWEVCRPTLPSLTIHRRLGMGKVMVQVPADQEEKAKEILDSHNIESK